MITYVGHLVGNIESYELNNFWFRGVNCFPVMSFDGVLYYIKLKWVKGIGSLAQI